MYIPSFIGQLHLYSKLVLCTLVQSTGIVYTCTVNWSCEHLYSKLVLCKLVQRAGYVYTMCGFVYSCTETDFVTLVQ